MQESLLVPVQFQLEVMERIEAATKSKLLGLFSANLLATSSTDNNLWICDKKITNLTSMCVSLAKAPSTHNFKIFFFWGGVIYTNVGVLIV